MVGVRDAGCGEDMVPCGNQSYRWAALRAENHTRPSAENSGKPRSAREGKRLAALAALVIQPGRVLEFLLQIRANSVPLTIVRVR